MSRSRVPSPIALVAHGFPSLVVVALVGCGGGDDVEPPPRQITRPADRAAPPEVEVPPREGSPVRFVDVAAEAGLDFLHVNGAEGEMYYVEFLSAGVIFFDADGDGDPDLFFTNGARLGPRASSGGGGSDGPAGPVNAFFRNDGTGHFTDATIEVGLDDARYSVGVCGADYDNDGDVDLYVTNFDADNALYRNDGEAGFVDVAREAGVTGIEGFASSCAFADYDNDGLVDLYVGNCLDHTIENNKVCQMPRRDGEGIARRYCNPENYHALPDLLYRNRGDGTFEDVSEASGISSAVGRTLGVAFGDYDDDGDQDLFVACDRSSNLYYENEGDGTFREQALTAGAALSNDGTPQAGMGIVSGDYDGDGRLDVAVTYFELEWNAFYRNVAPHLFLDEAPRNGTAPASFLLLAWGIDLFDADLDLELDAVVANGHFIEHVEWFRDPVAGYEQPNLFYLNRGGGLYESLGLEAGPGLGVEKVSRGLATADIDGDGDLDVVVANLHDRPTLLRNDSPRDGKHWLRVRLVGTRSNRSAIGARVTATTGGRRLVREVKSGQSYLSQSDLVVHFGAGRNERIDALDVRWPSGATTHLEDVAVDQVLEIVEPE